MKNFLLGVLFILIGLLSAGLIRLTTSPPIGEPITLRPPPTPLPITVHVVGAVQHPGVYALPLNSRIIHALEAAGGPRPEADLSNLNLAAPLLDGTQINIPENPLPAEPTLPASPPAPLLNINTATAEELANLPGIGSVTAQRIIEYRSQFGPFTQLEDLTKVFGIGTATFEQIKAFITLEP